VLDERVGHRWSARCVIPVSGERHYGPRDPRGRKGQVEKGKGVVQLSLSFITPSPFSRLNP